MKALKRFPKTFYFSLNPNFNSILYIKLLMMITHQTQVLSDQKSVQNNIQDINKQENVLIIAKKYIEDFMKIIIKIPKAKQGKKKIFVQLELFNEPISNYDGKMICLSKGSFPHFEFPIYQLPQQIPGALLNNNKIMLVVYYDQINKMQTLLQLKQKSLIFPLKANLQYAVQHDSRFVLFQYFHNQKIPPYFFFVGPYQQRVIIQLRFQMSAAVCIWLQTFKDLRKYDTYVKNKHQCNILYSKKSRAEFQRLGLQNKGLRKFKLDKEEIKEEKWSVQNVNLDKMFQDSLSGMNSQNIIVNKYSQEIFRKQWRRATVCVHNCIQNELYQFNKLFWMKRIKGKDYCTNNTANYHIYKKGSYIELPYGTHLILSNPQTKYKKQRKTVKYNVYQARQIQQISAQIQLCVAKYQHIFRFLKVYVVLDQELYQYLIEDGINTNFQYIKINSIQQLPIELLKDHPFIVIVPQSIAQNTYRLIQSLHGILVIFYQQEHLPKPMTSQYTIYVLNSLKANRLYINQILSNFVNEYQPIFDLNYKINKLSPMKGRIQLGPGYSNEKIHLKTFFANLQKRTKQIIQDQGKLVFCTQKTIYQVINTLSDKDKLFFLAEYPNYWKILYDRVQNLIAISSNVSSILSYIVNATTLNINLGLLRKTNRESFQACYIYLQLQDQTISNQIEYLYKDHFIIKRHSWNKRTYNFTPTLPSIIVIDSNQNKMIQDSNEQKYKNCFIFIYQRSDIKYSLSIFSKLSQVSIVTKLRKQLIGQISHYGRKGVKQIAINHIKINYK